MTEHRPAPRTLDSWHARPPCSAAAAMSARTSAVRCCSLRAEHRRASRGHSTLQAGSIRSQLACQPRRASGGCAPCCCPLRARTCQNAGRQAAQPHKVDCRGGSTAEYVSWRRQPLKCGHPNSALKPRRTQVGVPHAGHDLGLVLELLHCALGKLQLHIVAGQAARCSRQPTVSEHRSALPALTAQKVPAAGRCAPVASVRTCRDKNFGRHGRLPPARQVHAPKGAAPYEADQLQLGPLHLPAPHLCWQLRLASAAAAPAASTGRRHRGQPSMDARQERVGLQQLLAAVGYGKVEAEAVVSMQRTTHMHWHACLRATRLHPPGALGICHRTGTAGAACGWRHSAGIAVWQAAGELAASWAAARGPPIAPCRSRRQRQRGQLKGWDQGRLGARCGAHV